MEFIWPIMLSFLVLVPLLIVGYILLQRRRRRFTANYARLGLIQGSSGRGGGFQRHFPPSLFLAGLTILFVALARPQAVVSLPKVEGTVILAFDVSGSMVADDLKPTRMDAAKAAAKDFILRQPPYVQIGVVAFSDSGFTVQPSTGDREAIEAAINRLTPQRGTSIGNGIRGALNTLDAGKVKPPLQYSLRTPEPTSSPTLVPQGTYANAAIVLLTDGDNNEAPDPLALAQMAADRGVRIYTVGIGSAAGTTVHVNGFNVHTQLDEGILQQISEITGGTYTNAQSTQDLLKIYDNLSPQLTIKPQKTEITSLFGGASILVMLAGGIFSLLWFGRLP